MERLVDLGTALFFSAASYMAYFILMAIIYGAIVLGGWWIDNRRKERR